MVKKKKGQNDKKWYKECEVVKNLSVDDFGKKKTQRNSDSGREKLPMCKWVNIQEEILW